MITPIASTGRAMWRASCTALVGAGWRLRDDGHGAKTTFVSTVVMRRVYNEIDLTSAPSRILALDLGKTTHRAGHQRPPGHHRAGAAQPGAHQQARGPGGAGGLIREREVGLFLMGNPINMGGTEGRQSAWVREFADDIWRSAPACR